MQEILDQAVEEYHRKQFLEEANTAFARLKKDSQAWQDEQEERKAWDSTIVDGFQDDEKMKPSRGDIWLVDLNPVRGHEQAGKRPCLVISVDLFNHGPADLVIVLPITTKEMGIPFHVEIEPIEAGLEERSLNLK